MWLTRCGRRHCAVSALAGKEDRTPEDSNRLLSFVWAATQMKHAKHTWEQTVSLVIDTPLELSSEWFAAALHDSGTCQRTPR
jgi:hypothetical protein